MYCYTKRLETELTGLDGHCRSEDAEARIDREHEYLYEHLTNVCPDWEQRIQDGEGLYELAAEVGHSSVYSKPEQKP
jgi:hypothetical protein